MRNYVQIFAGTVSYNFIVGPVPPDFISSSIQGSLIELDSDLEAIAAQISNPFEVTGIDKRPCYVLLDKYNLLAQLRPYFSSFLNNPANGGLAWFDTQIGLIFNGPANTPRKRGFTDAEGKKRKPPPSERPGGPLLTPAEAFQSIYVDIDVVTPLLDLVKSLLKAGRKRDAGIVQYQIGELIAGRTTFVKLVKVLEDNNIFATFP